MRILVTNDDGVHAPGLAAMTRALAAWMHRGRPTDPREILVTAPLANYSGAACAVGTVYEREHVAYRAVTIEGAEDVPTFGIDGSPALSTIIGILGPFGERPDLVVSGINLGVNVGRSVLHSGTVGAVLTAAQHGLSGLAVSMKSGPDPLPWETASSLAVALLPALAAAPVRSIWNLNVPAVEPPDLRGVVRTGIGSAGVIKEVRMVLRGERPVPGAEPTEGEIGIVLGSAVPSLAGGDGRVNRLDHDAAALAEGYAAVTPLRGPHEDNSEHARSFVDGAIAGLSLPSF